MESGAKFGAQYWGERSRKASSVPPLKGVMGMLEDEWASSRILGDSHSSIVDLPLTAVQGELLSVAAWYDNEMGYSARLAEMAARIASSGSLVTQEAHKGVLAAS